jgi:XTP/dITP diphosphohydrolase
VSDDRLEVARPVLVAATANPAKLAEIAEILGGRVELLARPSSVGEIDEDAPDLEGNAILKARTIAAAAGATAIADDTGLEVDALDGAPGVRSARYAGDEASDADNVDKLLDELTGILERSARFHTVIAVVPPSGDAQLFHGWCEGTVAESPRGDHGFGYDPVFVPDDGDGRTFAEMSSAEKHAISHRGRALAALAASGAFDRNDPGPT